MSSIKSLGAGGASFDLESQINSVLTETNQVASEMARDVVDSIKNNNAVLKVLREMRAMVRDKKMPLLKDLLKDNPEIEAALNKLLPDGLPEEGTKTTKTTELDFTPDFSRGESFIKTKTTSSAIPISDEAWGQVDKAFDDIMENFQSFGQEAQINLQDVLSRVNQATTAITQISARFDGLSNSIIGNFRG